MTVLDACYKAVQVSTSDSNLNSLSLSLHLSSSSTEVINDSTVQLKIIISLLYMFYLFTDKVKLSSLKASSQYNYVKKRIRLIIITAGLEEIDVPVITIVAL